MREYSGGIWDHKQKEQDKKYFKELRDVLRVFRQNNEKHKILQILKCSANVLKFSSAEF